MPYKLINLALKIFFTYIKQSIPKFLFVFLFMYRSIKGHDTGLQHSKINFLSPSRYHDFKISCHVHSAQLAFQKKVDNMKARQLTFISLLKNIKSKVKDIIRIIQILTIQFLNCYIYFTSHRPMSSDKKKEITPSRTAKNYDFQTTSISYARQSDRKNVDQLRDKTNEPSSHQYSRQSKYSEKYSDGPSRYMDRQNMTLMREYQSLKLKVRQLQTQNKQLQGQLDKMDYQKSYIQKQYKQKIAFEEDSLLQFQKQKAYQIELLQIKNQEDLARLRRQYDIQVDDLQKQLKAQQYSNRQKIQQINYLEIRVAELKKQLQNVERELIKSRQSNSILNQRFGKEEFTSKRLQTLLEDVERQKNEMEMEIHVLLDIEAQKSRTINALQVELCNKSVNERSLEEKVNSLTENFTDLQSHITLMKERLLESDQQAIHLQKTLTLKQLQLKENGQVIRDQKERESELTQELNTNLTKMNKREKQVQELMNENQRLYRQLNNTRHQLHQISINHGIEL